ncbi:MAG TPA: translocation/assembly module TamB domain-containing protein [Candidatus Eisenbacteria bacterium]|nr:translocation/assembly module TamB domain-containing protein [Candidatus Eisenbacteria bacterium]
MSVLRRAAATFLGIAIVLLLLAGVALLLLQQPAVSRWALSRVVAAVYGVPRASVAIDGAGGDWITRLEARGLRVSRGGTVILRADTLRVAYSLLDALAGRFAVHDARVTGAFVTLAPADTSRSSRPALRPAEWLAGRFWSGRPIRIERLSLVRCAFETAGPDRAPRAEGIEMEARRIVLGGGGFAFDLDTLAARFLPAGSRDRWGAVTASASLDRRRLEVRSFSLASSASEVEAHGTLALGATPRDSITEADFTLRAPRLDLADLAILPAAPAMSGVVVAEAELHGTHLQTLRGTVGAETRRAKVGTLDLGHTRVRARLDGGRVELSLASEIADAPIEAEGWARPFDTAPTGALDGRVARLPRTVPGAPWWDPDASRTARFRASLERREMKIALGVEADSEVIALTGALDLPVSSRYRGRGIALTRTNRAGTTLPGGSLAIDSVEMTLGRVPSYRVMGARFSHVDLALWTRQPGASSDLNGTVDGEARGRRAEEARATLRLEPSTIRAQSIEHADLALSRKNGEISVRGEARAPSGLVQVSARARPFDRVPSYEAEEIRFRGVDVGPWVASPSVRTRLDGSLRLRLAGKTPETLAGSMDVRLEPSSVNGFPLDGADARGTIDRDRIRADLRIDSRAGAATLAGSGEWRARPPRLLVSGEVANAFLARLAGADSLDVSGATRFRIDASDARPKTASLRCLVDGSGRVAAATIDSLHAEIGLSQGVVSVDTLFARSNVGHVGGAGRLALSDSAGARDGGIRVTATIVNALPLASIVHLDTLDVESATFEGRLARAGRTIRFDATARVRRLTAGTMHVFGAEARTEGLLDPSMRLASGSAAAKLDRLVGPGLRLTSADVSVERDSAATRFEANARGEGGHEIRLAGDASSDSAALRIRLDRLDLVSKTRHWALAEPARLTSGRGRLAIESFDLRADSGRVVARGAVDRRGTQDLSLEMKGVEIDALTAWLGRPDMQGSLGGSLRLDGPAAAPRAAGHFVMALLGDAGSAGTASVAFDWDASRLSLDAGFTPPDGAPLTLSGRLPLALSLAAPDSGESGPIARVAAGDVDLRLRGAGVLLASLAPFLDPRSVIPREGALVLDARLTGKLDALAGSGRLEVEGGLLEFPALGVKYGGLALRSELKGGAIEIREARCRSGSGSLTAAGTIRLAGAGEAEVAIDLQARSFEAIRTRDYRSTLSGDLHMGGTLGAPVVSGALTFVDTDLFLAAAQTAEQTGRAEVTLTADDYRMLEEAFGYTVAKPPNAAQLFYDAARLDLKIVLGGNTWVRQRVAPRMAIQFTGSFQLQKAPYGEPLLVGRIAPVPGRGNVEQFARQFDLAGGEILLNGDMKSHVLDIKAEYKVPSGTEETRSKVVVHLDIQGRLDRMKLILSSDPPLDQSDIVSYIITGQTAFSGGRSQGDKSSGAATFATQVAMSGVTSRIEDLAQQKIGVDVVEVRQDGMEGVTLIAGQYVTPELYVGFRQPVGSTSATKSTSDSENKTEYELNYEVYRWLLLNLQGGSSNFKSFIRARREY